MNCEDCKRLDLRIIPKETRKQLFAVHHERELQDKKWGKQNHDPFTWLVVLMEEVGEASEAALKAHFGGNKDLFNYREEVIQVAAVAIAMLECIEEKL